jgi:glycosyltransferase involved in cell wall biosynthesis
VYYCVDEFSEWPGVARELVVSMERDLLGKVDMVVAVSDRLAASKTARRGPTHLLTHGVDADHFAAAQERAANPGAMENVSRPILGYYGLLDQRLDQELLEAVLRARPDWSVVAVGNAVTSLRRLERHANFHRLPAVPYQDLPAVARDFDVCIIPYVLNELSNNINPLKLKEYLAMGKPVVSTPLPEAEKLAPHVRLAGSAEAFVREVEAVLGGGFDPAPQLELVRSESWDGKADLLAAWISERLGGASADSAAGRAG